MVSEGVEAGQQQVTIVSEMPHVQHIGENGEAITFTETVEVPVSDNGTIIGGEVAGEMVMADGSTVADVHVAGAWNTVLIFLYLSFTRYGCEKPVYWKLTILIDSIPKVCSK